MDEDRVTDSADRTEHATATVETPSEPGAELGTAPVEPAVARPRGTGIVGSLRWGWRQLTSMRTALVLLFLLALAAIPGSLLPQRGVDQTKVAQYFEEHPDLAPVLDKLYGFDVFASPWFAAVYLLLFISLVGCIVPRTRAHYRQMRARPPKAPRNFSRLPHAERVEVRGSPQDAVAAAGELLRSRRFRVDVAEDGRSVAGEKGYLRETGNLAFHMALLVVLFAVAAGALFGYRGNVVVTEGDGFANTIIAYDSLQRGRLFSTGQLHPFTVELREFSATYVVRGEDRGTPKSFNADVRYRTGPGEPYRRYDVRSNAPLEVGDAKVYLLGHGYSPQITVRDANGDVVHSGATPFVPENSQTFLSQGVVKVPATDPQLGFQMYFLPTFAMGKQGPASAYPAPLDPALLMIGYSGDLRLDSGASQSVYELDTSEMKQMRLDQDQQLLRPGDKVRLPGGRGTVEFSGLKEFAALQVNHDPGKGVALVSASVAIAALLLSLFVRRRRVWVRAGEAESGRTVVEVGGLTRSDGAGGFAAEFAGLAEALRAELPARRRRDEGSTGTRTEET